MIEFKQVSVEFNNGRNDIKAVTDVSFTINDGEIFGIVGSSGAGKSTLLRTINGLESPTKGEVLIDGNAINQLYSKELSKVRSHIGMIFQQFNLINSKTVAQNIAFPLQVAGKSRGEIQKRVDELLEIVELKDKKYEHPSKLSGGQKQRVGIARALANNAKILLCDEPTSALDPDTTNSILELLRNLSSEFGITIVIITHELDVVKNTCSRVAVMDAGALVELNDVYELFTMPKECFTKKLIASNDDFKLSDSIVEETRIDAEQCSQFWSISKLTYIGKRASQPVISQTAKKFDVNINILHGRIEYIRNIPTGVMYLSFLGKHEEVIKAMEYVRGNVFNLEVLYEQ